MAQTLRDPFTPMSTSLNANGAMQTTLIPIHYADATTIAELLNNPRSHLLSIQGYVAVDARTNQLWIHEQHDRLRSLLYLIKNLDIPVTQVLIKARIVSADTHFLRSLGVLFGSSSTNTPSSNNTLAMDIPTSTTNAAAVNIPIIKFANGHLLDLMLTALEQEGHVEMLSSPELMTNNRQAAVIESGEEVPYQEKTGEGNTSTAFKKAALSLKVTPIVLPNKQILLQLTVNQDKISNLVVNGVPAIRTQQLTTTVLLKDQETVVLGGIYEETHQNEDSGVPGLRRMPLLGGLFRQQQQLIEHKQLMIFVTPRVFSNAKKSN